MYLYIYIVHVYKHKPYIYNANWVNIPAVNHLLLSLEVRRGCKHWGKTGSSWEWMSWTWLRREVHFATLSGPDVDVAAVQ